MGALILPWDFLSFFLWLKCLIKDEIFEIG